MPLSQLKQISSLNPANLTTVIIDLLKLLFGFSPEVTPMPSTPRSNVKFHGDQRSSLPIPHEPHCQRAPPLLPPSPPPLPLPSSFLAAAVPSFASTQDRSLFNTEAGGTSLPANFISTRSSLHLSYVCPPPPPPPPLPLPSLLPLFILLYFYRGRSLLLQILSFPTELPVTYHHCLAATPPTWFRQQLILMPCACIASLAYSSASIRKRA